MAAITSAVIGAGAALYAANKQGQAADKAASASQNATNAAINQQNLNYDRTAANLQPYTAAGTNALTGLQRLNSGDYSGFQSSPDYQFSLSQGLQGLDRSAAARGSLFSGGQQADILKYATGLAGQYLGNYRNALQSQANMGLTAGTSLGSIGAGQSGAIGNYLMGNAGNQTAAGYNSANVQSNLVNQLGGAAGQIAGQYGSTPAQTTASSYAGMGSPNWNYTGANSLATGWPAANDSTYSTSWPGFGNGFTLAGTGR